MSTRCNPPVRIGVVANPVSARDVRRILSNAAGLTLGERANMLVRLIHTLAACGVGEVYLMPEREGLRPLLERQIQRSHRRHHPYPLPRLIWLDMMVRGNIEDTFTATRMMCDLDVRVLMVLGGDGTHRAVAKYCGNTPIAAISSGTNNAFPPMREITVTALAAGLYAEGRIEAETALSPNKVLRARRYQADGGLLQEDLALVDIGILNEQILGAKAIGDTETLRTILVTQASPTAVGLSAVAAMLQPVSPQQPDGLVVELRVGVGPCEPGRACHVQAALAPGLIARIPVLSWRVLTSKQPYVLGGQSGLLSLDGEREMSFHPHERIEITLEKQAFYTLDVPSCLSHAARTGLMLDETTPAPADTDPL